MLGASKSPGIFIMSLLSQDCAQVLLLRPDLTGFRACKNLSGLELYRQAEPLKTKILYR